MEFNFDMLYLFICLFIGIVGVQQEPTRYQCCLTQKLSPIESSTDISLLSTQSSLSSLQNGPECYLRLCYNEELKDGDFASSDFGA